MKMRTVLLTILTAGLAQGLTTAASAGDPAVVADGRVEVLPP